MAALPGGLGPMEEVATCSWISLPFGVSAHITVEVSPSTMFWFCFLTIWLVQDVVMSLTAGHGSHTFLKLKRAVDVPKHRLAAVSGPAVFTTYSTATFYSTGRHWRVIRTPTSKVLESILSSDIGYSEVSP